MKHIIKPPTNTTTIPISQPSPIPFLNNKPLDRTKPITEKKRSRERER